MEGQVIVDAGSWAPWLSAVAAIIAIVIAVLSNVRSARKTELALVHSRISAVKDAVVSHGERLARVEAELEHLPSREMVAQLGAKLEEVSGNVRVGNAYYEGLRDRIDGIGTAVDQLLENELRGDRR